MSDVLPDTRRSLMLWIAAFFVGMIATPLLARVLGLTSGGTMAAMLPPMLLLIPMTRAAERHANVSGCGSAAMPAYNRRMMGGAFLYMTTLFAAVSIHHHEHVAGPIAWVVAILPAIGALAMLYPTARYLLEERDEYLRARAVAASLVATGLLLVTATFWGFLEMFRLVPHAPAWLAMPVWVIGFGLGKLVNRAQA